MAQEPNPEERRSRLVYEASWAAHPSKSKKEELRAEAQPDRGERPFGAMLEPVLRQACDGGLSAISWFRTTWQRGGAATGYATLKDGKKRAEAVVVKLPVSPSELAWLERLQGSENVAPRVYACGQTLGAYDIAWVVMEQLPFGPLGAAWGGAEFDLLVEAVGRFYAAANAVELPGGGQHKDWHGILEQARKNILKEHDVQHEQRWKNAIKKAQKKLGGWLKEWNNCPVRDWCHGDLHLANAMTRSEPPAGPAVLLDFAETRPGHWVEDAVYLEHLYWARRQRLGGRRLCSQIANERKKLGLAVDPEWARLASIKRALLAMSTPAMLQHDGDRHHVAAALEVLEGEVGG